MDLTQIRYFLSLARLLNFTRAAEACHVTQPALTKSIQRLEAELGGALLLRERSLTQLTPLGQAMLPLLEQTHAAAERAREHAASLQAQAAPPLRVGIMPEVPTQPFLPVFQELFRRLPGFELILEEAGSAGLCEALLQGTLDAAVVTGDAELPDRLNRWPLFADASVLLMPPGHALDSGDGVAVPLTALHGAAVVLRAPDCAMARLLEHRGDGARPGQRCQAGTPARVADLVRAGLGVAFSTRRAGVPGGLRTRPVAGQPPHEVLLVAVAGRPFTRAADAFIKLARARDWERLDDVS